MADKPTLLPPRLPLLPLGPPTVLFPYLLHAVTLTADELTSVLSAVALNLGTDGKGSRVVCCVPVDRDGGRKGRWGVAARIRDVDRSGPEDGEFLMVLEGLARVHLPANLPPILSLHHHHPLPTSSYSIPVPSPVAFVLHAELESLREQATGVLPKELHAAIKGLPPIVILDVLLVLSGVKWDVQVEALGLDDRERLERVKSIYSELAKDPKAIPSSAPLQVMTKPPARAIKPARKGLASTPPEDDLSSIRSLYTSRQSELTPEASQAIQRELARLANIPIQSAEYGVTKTYVEWLLAMPWKRMGPVRDGEVGLNEMREMLESEHEGLKDVKRRVIEYLAVYRLKRQLFVESQNRVSGKQQVETLKDASLMDPSVVPLPASISPEVLQNGTMDSVAPDEKRTGQASEPVFRDRGPILLLVGPPGVGKTSIARSLATALGRKYHRISLGGVRDEAEIRGHRRTYVGALPGMIVQGLRKVGVSNPLFLIDEIDKVGVSSLHGDPSAALLEVLDPEQNNALHDHYLGDVPIDLSQVMFIATANTLDTISAPLLDRCEVIECSGYVTSEKLAIAKRFLLPKQLEMNGLTADLVHMTDDALVKVATEYTREAGVRSLERELAKVARSKAVEYSISRDAGGLGYVPEVSLQDIERILGGAKYEAEVKEIDVRPGVVTGLAYQGSGTGGILLIEASTLPGGKGRLVLTGSLGDVIKESAELGLSWVKSHAYLLGLTTNGSVDVLKDIDIHLHLPAGAVRKDGPSAGVAIVLCFVSLLLGKAVPADVALTGEMTLRGSVTPVGGIREKVVGAHRAGITKLILPARNRKDVEADVAPEITGSLEIVYASNVHDVLGAVWGSEWREGAIVESRL